MPVQQSNFVAPECHMHLSPANMMVVFAFIVLLVSTIFAGSWAAPRGRHR
jgi:hypothetical protein